MRNSLKIHMESSPNVVSFLEIRVKTDLVNENLFLSVYYFWTNFRYLKSYSSDMDFIVIYPEVSIKIVPI